MYNSKKITRGMFLRLFYFIFTLLIPCLLLASTEVEGDMEMDKPPYKWNRELRFSFSSSSGNTDKESFSSRIKVEKPKGDMRFYADLMYFLEREDNDETENKLTADIRTEHDITEKFFYLFNGYFRRDKFSGVKYRAYGGTGLGLTIVDTKEHSLKVLDSINYEYEKLDDESSNSNVVNVFRLNYEFRINDKVKLGEDAKFTIALNDTEKYYVDSETYAQIDINKHLSFVLSYIVNYQNVVSEGDYKHTDRKLLMSIAFSF